MDLASVVAALASVGVRVSGSTPNSSVQVDSSRACPSGLAGPEPSGTINDPGQHFHLLALVEGTTVCLEIPLQCPPPPGHRHLVTVSPPHPGDRRALPRDFARGGEGRTAFQLDIMEFRMVYHRKKGFKLSQLNIRSSHVRWKSQYSPVS